MIMAQQQTFRGGPESGQIPHAKIKKAGLWVILGVLAFLLLLGVAIYVRFFLATDHTGQITRTAVAHQETTSSIGTVTYVSSGWSGVPIPPDKHIKTWCITPDVPRRVRVNQDPQREYDVVPGKKLQMGDDITYLEWKVQSGSVATEGKMGYELIPLN